MSIGKVSMVLPHVTRTRTMRKSVFEDGQSISLAKDFWEVT